MSEYKTISSKVVYKNPYFQVREDAVVKPNGKNGTFYVIDQHNGSVMIVPVTSSNEVYLIRLFRYTTQMYSWELPGGAMENEDTVENAKRELQEETGLTSTEWEDLGKYEAMNGSMSKVGHILLAKNVQETNKHEQEEEGITGMKKLSFADVLTMIKNNEITDSHTITALTLAGLKMNLIR